MVKSSCHTRRQENHSRDFRNLQEAWWRRRRMVKSSCHTRRQENRSRYFPHSFQEEEGEIWRRKERASRRFQWDSPTCSFEASFLFCCHRSLVHNQHAAYVHQQIKNTWTISSAMRGRMKPLEVRRLNTERNVICFNGVVCLVSFARILFYWFGELHGTYCTEPVLTHIINVTRRIGLLSRIIDSMQL
jgi:hypothetical protein